MDAKLLALIEILIQGGLDLVTIFHNKTADQIAADIGQVNAIAMAVLKKTAEIQGLSIDWSNADAVRGYVASLPDFVAIPEPPKN
jgi:hypothetical protein